MSFWDRFRRRQSDQDRQSSSSAPVDHQPSAKIVEHKPAESPQLPPLYVALGIDFGTRYTRVAWRDVGSDQVGVIRLPAGENVQAIVPSCVDVGQDGRLRMCCDAKAARTHRIRYLKMHLAGRAITEIPDSLSKTVSSPAEILSLFLLARVMNASREAFLVSRPDLTKGREVRWFPTVGVPSSHFGSKLERTFRTLARQAWQLSVAMEQGSVPLNPAPSDLESWTQREEAKPSAAESPITVYSEIFASVLPFLAGQSAIPGVYIYFDIGGGTLDGVAFRYTNVSGHRRAEHLAARVSALGLDAVVHRICRRNGGHTPQEVKRLLWVNDHVGGQEIDAEKERLAVQRSVAKVVAGGKTDDPGDWHRENPQEALQESIWKGRGRRRSGEHLIVFIGGGGTSCRTYKSWIYRTHAEFQHARVGIPPYEIVHVSPPTGLALAEDAKTEYHRLSVAIGLTMVPTSPVQPVGGPDSPSVDRPDSSPSGQARRYQVDLDTRAIETYGETL